MPRAPSRRRARGGRVPIVVGGTGLYFKVLLEGLSPVPAIDPDVRAYWRGQAAARPAPELHAILSARDAADGRAPDADRPAAHRARARGAGKHRAIARRLAARAGQAGAGGTRDRALAGGAGPRNARQPSSTHASMPCWRQARSRRCGRCWRSGFSDELPVMRALGVAPLAAHLARRDVARGGGGGCQDRDTAIRQAAADLAETKYDFLEEDRYATNGKNRPSITSHLVNLSG